MRRREKLNSIAVTVLFETAVRMRGRGRLLLCRPSPPVRRVLDVLQAEGLDGLEVVPEPAWEVMRRLFVALAHADPGVIREMVADNAVWHVPGHNAFSGLHKGQDAIITLAARMKEHTAEYIHEIQDVTWGEDHVAVMANVWGDREGKILLGAREAMIFRVAGGLVVEGWSYLFDPDELDAFWS